MIKSLHFIQLCQFSGLAILMVTFKVTESYWKLFQGLGSTAEVGLRMERGGVPLVTNSPQVPGTQGLHQAASPKPPVPSPMSWAGCSLSFPNFCPGPSSCTGNPSSLLSQGPAPSHAPSHHPKLSVLLCRDTQSRCFQESQGTFHPFREKYVIPF